MHSNLGRSKGLTSSGIPKLYKNLKAIVSSEIHGSFLILLSFGSRLVSVIEKHKLTCNAVLGKCLAMFPRLVLKSRL